MKRYVRETKKIGKNAKMVTHYNSVGEYYTIKIFTAIAVLIFIFYVLYLIFGGDKNEKGDSAEKNIKQDSAVVSETTDAFPESLKAEFVFWDSNIRYLSDEEVKNLEPLILQAAINEIYARHGRIWPSDDWNQYFMAKSWYEPKYSADEFPEDIFNDYEKANIDLLASYRQ